MRWPWRRDGAVRDSEGKAEAKMQLEIAKVIERESFQAASQSEFLLYKNHFAHDIRKAMGGNR